MPVINARSLKCTAVLPPEAVLGLVVPNGVPRFVLTIAAGDGRYTVDLNAKSVRKAQATIRENGADGVSAIVQGRLSGDAIVEGGLTVQPKRQPLAANW